MNISTYRLAEQDIATAKSLFTLMSEIFAEVQEPLGESYLGQLLADDSFWAIAAFSDGHLAGGLTAHTLPMTRSESSEIFIYDIAVRESCRRRGVGKALVNTLLGQARQAGIDVAFVPADNGDTHALDFYRAVGGVPSPVTLFTFGEAGDR